MKCGINLKGLLVGDLTKLRYVTRFSTCQVMHRESVAEHTFYVTFYAMVLADICEQEGIVVDYATLMHRAMVHDIDEARTGDFNRPFKYSSEALKKALDLSAEKAVEQVVATFLEPMDPRVGSTSVWYLALWKESKAADVEGCIVAFADFLSVLSYMLQELQVSNATMYDQRLTMVEYLETYKAPQYDFIRWLVDEAAELVERMRP